MSIDIELEAIASFYWSEEQAKRIREAREASGYSRAQLSEKTGISLSYLQQMESPGLFLNKNKKSKQMTVTREKLEQVCQTLGIKVASLIWEISMSTS